MASKFQEKVIKSYEKKGFVVINLSKTNKNGIADLLVAKAGYKTSLIECKEKGDTVKDLQFVQNKLICKKADWNFYLFKDGAEPYKVDLDESVIHTDLF